MKFKHGNFKLSVEHISKIKEYENLKLNLRDLQKSYTTDYIEVGDFTYGVPEVYFSDRSAKLKIGKFCSFASGIKIFLKGDHNVNFVTTYPFNILMPNSFGDIKGHPITKGDVIIGNDVWGAADCTIMSGVKIGDGAVIANKSLVTKDVPPYTIVGGIPARVIKKRFDDNLVAELLKIQWWNWDDQYIIDAIRLLQSNKIDKLIEYYYTKVNQIDI